MDMRRATLSQGYASRGENLAVRKSAAHRHEVGVQEADELPRGTLLGMLHACLEAATTHYAVCQVQVYPHD